MANAEQDEFITGLEGKTGAVISGGLSGHFAKVLYELYPVKDNEANEEVQLARESMAIDQSNSAGIWEALTAGGTLGNFDDIKGFLSFDAQTAALSDYARIADALQRYAGQYRLRVIATGEPQSANMWARNILEACATYNVEIFWGVPDAAQIEQWTKE